MLIIYGVVGLSTLWLNEPTMLLKIATLLFNFALGFSCCYAIVVNSTLLPPKLCPNLLVRFGLLSAGCFFLLLGCISVTQTLRELGVLEARV